MKQTETERAEAMQDYEQAQRDRLEQMAKLRALRIARYGETTGAGESRKGLTGL